VTNLHATSIYLVQNQEGENGNGEEKNIPVIVGQWLLKVVRGDI
jgi:hypothetical protein